MKPLCVILWFWVSLASAATTYYASPSGCVTNTGLSTDSPWPMDWAVDHAGVSNIVCMMDGDYGSFTITQAWLTVKAINKWQARVTNAPDVGVFGTDNTDGITLDGIQVTNSLKTGIETAGDFITIRNCWVHHCADSGIATYQTDTESVSYNLFEGNLVEYNGDPRGEVPGLGHGIYVGGVHNTIRNNVSRYNGGFGIQIYPRPNQVMDQNSIYQNFCHGNDFYATEAGGGIVIYASDSTNLLETIILATNHIWGNTVIEPDASDGAIVLRYGFGFVTNNILVNSNARIHVEGGATVWADYNAGTKLMDVTGDHDVITDDLGFVSTNTGCYWLASDSPLRGAALSSVYGPVNFFGTNQTSVTDIGAFQYSVVQAEDTRTLDPSPTAGANYWKPVSNSLTVNPTTLDFSVLEGIGAGNQAFAVSNSGSGILNWSAVTDGGAPSWLALSPTNGTGDGTVNVAVTSASLAPGNYRRTITVSAVGATNSPQTVTVNLKVTNGLAPLITSVIVTNGVAVITWTTTPGKTYKVQSKAKPSDLEWSDFSPDILATGPAAVYADVSDLNDRFFRILLVH